MGLPDTMSDPVRMRMSSGLPVRSRQLAAWIGALLLVGACGGDSTGPSHVVTAVTVTGGRDTLYVGQTMTLGA